MKTALLFDLDGTLVDSDAEHLIAFPAGICAARDCARSFRIRGEHHGRAQRNDRQSLPCPFVAARAGGDPGRQGGGLPRRFGRDRAYCSARSRCSTSPTGAGSSAPSSQMRRAPTPRRFWRRLGIGPRLPIVVIGGELQRSKPDPLPYLTALERTGAVAAHSLAFEEFSVGRSLRRRGGARRGGHDDHAQFANPDRSGRDIRGQQFHRSADLRAD